MAKPRTVLIPIAFLLVAAPVARLILKIPVPEEVVKTAKAPLVVPPISNPLEALMLILRSPRSTSTPSFGGF